MTKIRVAAWAYPIERLASWDAWVAKLDAAFAEARGRGARLCVVPEYAAMELTALTGGRDLAAQLDALQPRLADYHAVYAEQARKHELVIVAGSFPEQLASGEVRNRACVHAGGKTAVIEKQQMTRFEAEHWGIAGGPHQLVLELDGFKLGVALCYDAEFPLIVRRLVAAGAQIIAVPSCTDTLAGYHRVRIACQARALENQCYVVQAPTVGVAPWSVAVDESWGAAGVFAPPDRGLPDDGVIALGELNVPGLVVTDLDLAALARVRADGQVLGHRDWDRPAHVAGWVRTVVLA